MCVQNSSFVLHLSRRVLSVSSRHKQLVSSFRTSWANVKPNPLLRCCHSKQRRFARTIANIQKKSQTPLTKLFNPFLSATTLVRDIPKEDHPSNKNLFLILWPYYRPPLLIHEVIKHFLIQQRNVESSSSLSKPLKWVIIPPWLMMVNVNSKHI